MNALDLLHKIRTCDRRGNFTYTDTQVLNDLIEAFASAETSARQIAIEQSLRVVRELREGTRNEIYAAIERL